MFPPADNAQPAPAPTWENEQYRNQELFGLFQNNEISVFSANERWSSILPRISRPGFFQNPKTFNNSTFLNFFEIFFRNLIFIYLLHLLRYIQKNIFSSCLTKYKINFSPAKETLQKKFIFSFWNFFFSSIHLHYFKIKQTKALKIILFYFCRITRPESARYLYSGIS